MRVPLRPLRRIFCTTSLCAWGQYQLERSAHPSTTSPTKYRVSASWWRRKSSSRSAWEPRGPRCTSEMNNARYRRTVSVTARNSPNMRLRVERLGLSCCLVCPAKTDKGVNAKGLDFAALDQLRLAMLLGPG